MKRPENIPIRRAMHCLVLWAAASSHWNHTLLTLFPIIRSSVAANVSWILQYHSESTKKMVWLFSSKNKIHSHQTVTVLLCKGNTGFGVQWDCEKLTVLFCSKLGRTFTQITKIYRMSWLSSENSNLQILR